MYEELCEKHGDTLYSEPQLRLWARMIHCSTYDSRETPPPVPIFQGTQPKKARRESLTEVFVDAASAFSRALKSPDRSAMTSPDRSATKSPDRSTTKVSPGVGISPGKSVELRSKHFEQLRHLQQLYEDKILSENDFLEQKQLILDSLRKLTQ